MVLNILIDCSFIFQAMLPSPTPSRATLAEVPITQGLNDYDTIRRYSKFTAMDESE